MEQVHRTVLEQTTPFLIKNMYVDTELMSWLVQEIVLEMDDMDVIGKEASQDGKCMKLINILVRRGPEAFNSFLKALNNTHQEHVVAHLEENCRRLLNREESSSVDGSIITQRSNPARVVQRNLVYIVDNLRINYEFLSMFIQDSTLTFDDVQEIMQKPSYSQQAHAFCSKWIEKEHATLDTLLNALDKTKQAFLKDKLCQYQDEDESPDMEIDICQQESVNSLSREMRDNMSRQLSYDLDASVIFVSYLEREGALDTVDAGRMLNMDSNGLRVHHFVQNHMASMSLNTLHGAFVESGQSSLGDYISNRQFENEMSVVTPESIDLMMRNHYPRLMNCISQLGRGVDVKIRPDGTTLLHSAAEQNICYMVEELLNRGADPNVKNDAGETPLYIACRHGHGEVASKLLSVGAQLHSSTTPTENTPLHAACMSGNVSIVQQLIDKDAPINPTNALKQTPLFFAVFGRSGKSIDIIKSLLNKGANIFAQDTFGKTALHYAAAFNNEQMIDALIPHRNPHFVNIQDSEGLTPSHVAVKFGSNGVLRQLYGKGANIDLKTAEGYTVSDFAKIHKQDVAYSFLSLR